MTTAAQSQAPEIIGTKVASTLSDMNKENDMAEKNKVGLVVGALLGGWHLVWSVLVATGLGQALYEFILWAHMIHLSIVVGPFDLAASATLVVVTSIFGYVIGYTGAWVWNIAHAR